MYLLFVVSGIIQERFPHIVNIISVFWHTHPKMQTRWGTTTTILLSWLQTRLGKVLFYRRCNLMSTWYWYWYCSCLLDI